MDGISETNTKGVHHGGCSVVTEGGLGDYFFYNLLNCFRHSSVETYAIFRKSGVTGMFVDLAGRWIIF